SVRSKAWEIASRQGSSASALRSGSAPSQPGAHGALFVVIIVVQRIVIGLKLFTARTLAGAGAEIVILRLDLVDIGVLDQKCVHELRNRGAGDLAHVGNKADL